MYPITLPFFLSTMNKDRSRWEIILDVLKAIQENNKAKKTRIMQRAYLDWRIFDRYFTFLLGEGFIEPTPDTCYRLTEKGEGLVTRLQEVDEIAGSKWRVLKMKYNKIPEFQYS